MYIFIVVEQSNFFSVCSFSWCVTYLPGEAFFLPPLHRGSSSTIAVKFLLVFDIIIQIVLLFLYCCSCIGVVVVVAADNADIDVGSDYIFVE